MAIAPRSGTATATTVGTAATGWTVNLPTFAADDVVVIMIGSNVGSTAGTPTATGWTSFVTNESSALKGTFLYRQMTGSEGSTISVTFGGSTSGGALATAFTGVDTTTQIDAGPVGQAEASGSAVTAHVTPSLTTVTANAVLVSGFTTDVTATWTSTDTELGDLQAGTVSTALYYSAPVTVGSYTRTGTASAGSVKAVSSLLALRPTAGPATTPISVAGSVTAAGVVPRLTTHIKGGSSTFAGVKVSLLGPRTLAGSLSSSGAAVKMKTKPVAGAFTAAGAITTAVSRFRTVAGSLTGAGGLARIPNKRPAGTSTGVGVVSRFVSHVAAGSVTGTGVAVKAPRRVVSGAFTAAGVIVRNTTRVRAVAGSLTVAGVTLHRAWKSPGGTVTGTGVVKRPTSYKRAAGAVTFAGHVLADFLTRVFGPAGTVTLTIGPVADTEMTVYLRHQVRTTVTVTADAVLTPRG